MTSSSSAKLPHAPLPAEWELYGRIRKEVDRGQFREALVLIERGRKETKSIGAFVACLEATCYERLGDRNRAIYTLEDVARMSVQNYWVFHQLAASYRNAGRLFDCFQSYQQAHALHGWSESKGKGYEFTHDFFSANIPDWVRWFSEHVVSKPIEILEIGSWQGGSTMWMLDKIVSTRGGRLTCVDTFAGSSEHAQLLAESKLSIEALFDSNLNRSGHGELCRKLIGFSQEVLRELYRERFDFIYIDGAHEARWVLEDAVLSFGLLKSGGYMLFDDYDFKFEDRENQNTARAIDFFVDVYGAELEIIEVGRQMFLRRRR